MTHFSDFSKELQKDIVQWDVKTWSRAIQFWDTHVDWSKHKIGLEIGGRNGGISLYFINKGMTAVCSDISNVEETAAPLHKKHKAQDSISYEILNACELPEKEKFDVIALKSIIGGIGYNDNKEAQEQAFKSIYQALKPGGKLIFAENVMGTKMHQFARSKFNKWGTWRYPTLSEMDSFMADFSSVDYGYTGLLAGFGRSEKQRSVLANVDQLFFNWSIPNSWCYLCYGVATK